MKYLTFVTALLISTMSFGVNANPYANTKEGREAVKAVMDTGQPEDVAQCTVALMIYRNQCEGVPITPFETGVSIYTCKQFKKNRKSEFKSVVDSWKDAIPVPC